MATPSPEPSSPSSWQRLAADARAQRPPAIDVRATIRAAILANNAAEPTPSWSEGLLDFLRLPWARASLAVAMAAALLLCASGWWSLSQEMSDPIALALQQDAMALFTSSAP